LAGSVVLRYGAAVAVFGALLALPFVLGRVAGVNFDSTFLIIIAMIAAAWYLGRGPGLLIALLFEATLVYFSPGPFTAKAAFVTFNRLLLFVGVVVFAGSRRKAESVLKEQQELLRVTLAGEQAARPDAERANREKDEFLATLSHELRTPLNSMQGWISLLLENGLEPSQHRQSLETIRRNISSQRGLVEDLLDVSGLVTGKFTIERKPVSLLEVVKDSVDACQPAARLRGITIETILDPTVGYVEGDAGRLRQIVDNLLGNAVKFSHDGGKVTVELSEHGDRALLTVRDEGCGISADMLPRVFDRFWQADGTTRRRHSGLGLGLSIARQLAELHGGRITASSDGEGKGSTFTVELPTEKPAAAGA
jgi:signal transduction histidine kinase